jgi:hypothetical protein
MDLFDIIDYEKAIFLPIQDEVHVSWFDHNGLIMIFGVQWNPPKLAITFAEKYRLFREHRIASCYCMCCWDGTEDIRDGIICPNCNRKISQAEEKHKTWVLLIGQLPVVEDVTWLITAAYCMTVACEIDEHSRQWTFDRHTSDESECSYVSDYSGSSGSSESD